MTAESTRFGQLFDDVKAEVPDLQEVLGTIVGVIGSILENSCATIWPNLRSLIENFRASPDKSVGKALCNSSVGS